MTEIKSVSKNDVDKLLRCRKAIDDHRERKWKDEEERTASTNAYMKVLNSNGFKDVSEFIVFNDLMNKEEYVRSRPIRGTCDKCAGYRDPITGDTTPPCVKIFSSRACYNKQPTKPTDSILKETLISRKKNTFKVKDGIMTVICPYPPHGFYVLEKEMTPLNFDIDWRI